MVASAVGVFAVAKPEGGAPQPFDSGRKDFRARDYGVQALGARAAGLGLGLQIQKKRAVEG